MSRIMSSSRTTAKSSMLPWPGLLKSLPHVACWSRPLCFAAVNSDAHHPSILPAGRTTGRLGLALSLQGGSFRRGSVYGETSPDPKEDDPQARLSNVANPSMSKTFMPPCCMHSVSMDPLNCKHLSAAPCSQQRTNHQGSAQLTYLPTRHGFSRPRLSLRTLLAALRNAIRSTIQKPGAKIFAPLAPYISWGEYFKGRGLAPESAGRR